MVDGTAHNPIGSGSAYALHVHSGTDEWIWASAVAIAAELRRDLSDRPRARLLLSGGTTPAPVYRALAQAPLDWSRVDVALVDERWLLPDDPDSNAYLVNASLLHHYAKAARFEVMTQPGLRIEDVVARANAHAQQPAAAAVLGMGEDGHTASMFPGSIDLERALASRQAYAAVDATGCPGARQWLRRITLTPAGLAGAHAKLLLIQGAGQRAVLERALADGDVTRWPVLAALGGGGEPPLQIHWCP